LQTESSTGLLLNLVASPSLTEIGAEPNGNLYVKVVQQVRSERACQQAAAEAPLQAGGLPRRAGPSTGGRPSPAACPRSVSEAQAGCKRKGLEEGSPTAVQLPAKKRARGQSGDGVPAPAAQPGPAAARSSKRRGKQVLWHRRAELLPCSSTLSLLRVCFAFSFSEEGKWVEGYKVPRQ